MDEGFATRESVLVGKRGAWRGGAASCDEERASHQTLHKRPRRLKRIHLSIRTYKHVNKAFLSGQIPLFFQ